MIHSLLTQVYQDAVLSVVAAMVSFLLGTLVGARVKKWWQAHERTQRLIADRLDTATPGGLGDVDAKLDRLTDR